MHDDPTPFWTAITNPDWATFLPDLIAAAVTGLFVGLVLYFLTRSVETRRERFETELLWDDFRREAQLQVQNTVIDPKTWISMNLVNSLNDYTRPLLELTEGRRLSSWAKTLKNPEIRLLHEVVSDIRAARFATTRWNSEMVRATNERATVVAGHVDMTRPYVAGLTLGMSESEVLAVLGLQTEAMLYGVSGTQISAFEEARRMMTDPALEQVAPMMKSALEKLTADYSTLRSGMERVTPE